VISTTFEYQRATSIDDAVARLAASANAKLIAGGHSLVPLMKLRLSEPAMLIDIARIPGLAGIREKDGRIEIGAGTTHSDVAASTLLREACPVVAETASEIGDPQVRNRGTLGGSLAHADPAADYPAAMLAVDAEIHLKGPKGWRTVRAADFFQGLFTVDLAPDEMIVGIQFAPVRAAAYAKLHQRASHFALVGVAAALDLKGGVIQGARVGITGAGTHATRLVAVEQALAGRPATPPSLERASSLATLDEVNADIHAGEEYRRAMIRVFTKRALEGALARA
jgi:carbon-monoxide dehydrogenase medium subunit